MHDEYLMYTASALFFLCYLPELYANYKNKNANFYNVPEKAVIFIGTLFALSYSIRTENNTLIIHYTPILFCDTISLTMRFYYAYENRITKIENVETTNNDKSENKDCNYEPVVFDNSSTE
jgi:uncharacterized protein with PQ loop repeat